MSRYYNGSARVARRKQRDLKLAGRAGPYVQLEEGSKPRGFHWASQLFLPLLVDYFSHVEVKWNLVKHYLITPGQMVLLGQPTSASLDFILYLTPPGQIVLPGQPTSASLHFSLYLTTPGQIENIGALSTTGLTLLTSGLVDWPQRRNQVLLLQDWAVLHLPGHHLTLDQQGNHQVLGKCSLEFASS